MSRASPLRANFRHAFSADDAAGMLIKIGAKVVRHGCYAIFQMGEVAVSRELFQEIL